ncbi:hypothetical protein C8R47DRAFT_36453 [Mycena vitilis]|nr:hypothetical protein C8R47DRAFT_36453 [Mycena vitilis]
MIRHQLSRSLPAIGDLRRGTYCTQRLSPSSLISRVFPCMLPRWCLPSRKLPLLHLKRSQTARNASPLKSFSLVLGFVKPRTPFVAFDLILFVLWGGRFSTLRRQPHPPAYTRQLRHLHPFAPPVGVCLASILASSDRLCPTTSAITLRSMARYRMRLCMTHFWVFPDLSSILPDFPSSHFASSCASWASAVSRVRAHASLRACVGPCLSSLSSWFPHRHVLEFEATTFFRLPAILLHVIWLKSDGHRSTLLFCDCVCRCASPAPQRLFRSGNYLGHPVPQCEPCCHC